jgi:5-formyltetrahydrofolate cyclo-ligase
MPLLLIHHPDKSELRREARMRRRAVDAYSRGPAEAAIAEAIRRRMLRAGWRQIAAYAAVASEASLSPWFDRIDGDIELCLPAVDDHGVMSFRRWRPGEPLRVGPFSIEQPATSSEQVAVASLDLILMPLLGFDASGTRLGSGAGYYDRALASRGQRAVSPVLVGVGFTVQQFEHLPRDPWDVPLDAIVTESGWIELQRVDRRRDDDGRDRG